MLWIAVNLHVKENICITIYIAHLKEEVVLFFTNSLSTVGLGVYFV